MIIGEGDARHAVENEIRPFRDLFVGISASERNCHFGSFHLHGLSY